MSRSDVLLSWNMKAGPTANEPADAVTRRINLLSALVRAHAPSLVALQEAPSAADVRNAIGVNYQVERTEHGVVSAYDTRRWRCDEKVLSEKRVAVLGLSATGAGTTLWMVNIHGHALNVGDAQKREFFQHNVRRIIEELRKKPGEREEVLVGDFNLPPFDDAIRRKGGLHGNRYLPWVRSNASGLDRGLFNPTWRLLARHDGASGTYYRSGVDLDGPWNVFDQVLVTAGLAKDLTLHPIEAVGTTVLRRTGAKGAPDVSTGSDHLPLFAELQVP